MKIIRTMTIAFALAGAAFTIARMLDAVVDTTQLNYAESIVLWQASLLSNLKAAFHPIQQYPHIVIHYPPLYHLALRTLSATGMDAMLAGRIVSFISGMWVVMMLAYIAFHSLQKYLSRELRWFCVVITIAFAVQVPSFANWVPLVRVDLLGLAFQFSGLALFCLFPFSVTTQVLVGLLFVLGLYSKQSLVTVPLAVLLILLIIQPKRAVALGAGMLAAGLLVLASLSLITDGGVIRHWLTYNRNPFHLSRVPFAELKASPNLLGLVALALTGAVILFQANSSAGWKQFLSRMKRRLEHSILRRSAAVLVAVVVIGFIVSFGVAKEGSDINYCLEWQLALCPLAGMVSAWSLKTGARRMVSREPFQALTLLLVFVTALTFAIGSVDMFNVSVGLTGARRAERRAVGLEEERLIKLIASYPGPVMSENMMLLIRAGKEVPLEPAIVKQNVDTGGFDERPLLAKINGRFFDLIVLERRQGDSRFTPAMLDAVHKSYVRLPDPTNRYEIYARPQARSAESSR